MVWLTPLTVLSVRMMLPRLSRLMVSVTPSGRAITSGRLRQRGNVIEIVVCVCGCAIAVTHRSVVALSEMS